MQSKATTVEQYLSDLPPERRAVVSAVRAVILDNLDADYTEGMQYRMIGYFVPHRVFPPGYHCDPKQPLPFAHLASQKNYFALYMMCLYGCEEGSNPLSVWFREVWQRTGKKLDMGKSCIRFRSLDDLALDVIGETIRRVPAKKLIEIYQSSIRKSDRERAAKQKTRSRRTKPK